MKELPKRSAMETGQSHFSSPKARTLQHWFFPQRGYMVPNCLNGKCICINRQLLADQLFLPVLCFVFKGKPHFSFLSSPPGFSKHKRTPAHAKGQTSSAPVDRKGLHATGAGVFLCFTPQIIQPLCYFE